VGRAAFDGLDSLDSNLAASAPAGDSESAPLVGCRAEQSGNAINTLGRNCVPNAFRWLCWQSTLAMASGEFGFWREKQEYVAPTSRLVLICLAHLQEMCP